MELNFLENKISKSCEYIFEDFDFLRNLIVPEIIFSRIYDFYPPSFRGISELNWRASLNYVFLESTSFQRKVGVGSRIWWVFV